MHLTNEQRAHDLAVATLPIMKDVLNTQIINGTSSENSFDAYFEYKKLYDAFLEACNKDFKS